MKKLLLLMTLIFSLGLAIQVNAENNQFDDNELFPDWRQGSKPIGVVGENGGSIEQLNKRGTKQGLLLFFPTVINYALFAVGAIVVVILIYAGIKLLIAQGSDENHEKSKRVFQYAIIGFLFAISAYTLVRVAFEIIIDRDSRAVNYDILEEIKLS